MREILIRNTQIEHLAACAELQRLCFPTLAPEERFSEAQIANHIRIFPDGQFVAIHEPTGQVVAMTAGFRTHFDFAHTHGHTYLDATSHCWFSRHNPRGLYYYGADMSVHPGFRGRGLARKLHDARKAMAKELGLKGQVACGMLPGYAEYKHVMTVHDYVRYVIAGTIFDATLTTQLRNGFVVRGLIDNYVQDAPTDGWAALIEWPNPAYAAVPLPAPYSEFAQENAKRLDHTV